MNTAKLKGKMRELGMTQQDLANITGKSLSAINRKLQREDGELFSISEANLIAKAMHLTQEETSAIFFSDSVV